MVLFPLINPDEEEFQIVDAVDEDTFEEWIGPHVMVPVDLFKEYPSDTMSDLEVKLLNQTYDDDMSSKLGLLMKNRLADIGWKEKMRENSNENYRKGSLYGKVVHLKSNETFSGCLVQIKGTKEFLTSLKKDMYYCQSQNGKSCLSLVWKLLRDQKNVLDDDEFVIKYLKTKGYTVKKIRSGENRVCCSVDCDPDHCLNGDHKQPNDFVRSDGMHVDPFFVVRYFSEKVDIFIKTVIKPAVKEYSLMLCFDREDENGNCGVSLCGNLWLNVTENGDLEEQNCLKQDILSAILGEGTVQMEYVDEYVSYEPTNYLDHISVSTENRLEFNDKENTRETSVFEFLFHSLKMVPTKWFSQSVAFVLIDDPREVWLIEFCNNSFNSLFKAFENIQKSKSQY